MYYSYRIELAIRAAAVLHDGQVRKGSTPFPYITHLFAVAMLVSDYSDDEDVLIAALLHDTIEDTDYTEGELKDDFGGNVKELVLAVTEPETAAGETQNWKAVKAIYVKQLRKAPEKALLIAAADKIHNMRTIVEDYYDNHSQFLADFGGKLEERILMYQEISNILNRRLNNDIIHEFNNVFTEYKNFIENVRKDLEIR